jgi:hypothetical protein
MATGSMSGIKTLKKQPIAQTGPLVPLIKNPGSVDEDIAVLKDAQNRAAGFYARAKKSGLGNKDSVTPAFDSAKLEELNAIGNQLGARVPKGLEHGVAAITGAERGVVQPLYANPLSDEKRVRDIVDAILSNEAGTKKLTESAVRGKEAKADEWYDLPEFLNAVGPERGDEIFGAFGPTSQMTGVDLNVKKGSLIDYVLKHPAAQKKDLEEVQRMAQGVAGDYGDQAGELRYLLNSNVRDVSKMRSEGSNIPWPSSLLSESWKTPHYTGSMMGFQHNAAGDTHLIGNNLRTALDGKSGKAREHILKLLSLAVPEKAMTPAQAERFALMSKSEAPWEHLSTHASPDHYTGNWLATREMARRAGMPTRNFQSSTWVDQGDINGLMSTRENLQDILFRIIDRNAVRTNSTRDGILRKMKETGYPLR